MSSAGFAPARGAATAPQCYSSLPDDSLLSGLSTPGDHWPLPPSGQAVPGFLPHTAASSLGPNHVSTASPDICIAAILWQKQCLHYLI